jgi:flagellar hook-associated protein 1 FlgK
MSSLSIGLSGLLVDQRLLDLTGQNITNANTPDYHNQVADLAENVNTGDSVGAGVSITGITREVNQLLEQAATSNSSDSSSTSTQLDSLNQVQSFLATGTGTLHDSLGNLLNDLEALTAQPSDPTMRQQVLADANSVATQMNATVNSLQQVQTGLVGQANTYTSSINALTAQIGQLNQQIHDATIQGQDANPLLDQRDQAVSSLSQLIDVRTIAQPYGEVNVFGGGAALVLNTQAVTLSTGQDKQGNLIVTAAGAQQPMDVSGGQLGGTVALANTTLPAISDQLNVFAQALVTQFDHIQATGLGLNGPMTELTSQRAVPDVNQPLAVTNLAFPPQKGNLYIDVTNQSTGQTTLTKVAVDPSTQSLTSVASAISAVPNLQAVVDPQSGTLHIMAAPGYAFDFTGSLSSTPDAQTMTGTATASIDGQYTGSADGTLKFAFSGPGTIGVTPNLTLQVTNSAGTLLGSVNVGQGYAPGSDVAGALGVNVNLSAGTVNAGDSFSVNVTANPDSANLLTALGLNTFFVGSDAGDLQVNPNLMNNPAQLATSTTGQPGDGSNLAKMAALQNQPVLANGSQTLLQNLETLIGNVGTQVNDLQSTQSAQQALGQQLNNQIQSASGVDTNEALTQLVQYQQAYQMSAKFVSVVSQNITDLLNILQTVTAG